MRKNPFLNAVLASVYITGVTVIMRFGSKFAPDTTFLGPVAMLSLFTLSAAVVGYLFLSQPLQLYLDGKKPEAVRFFLQTVAAFAAITALVFLMVFLGLGR